MQAKASVLSALHPVELLCCVITKISNNFALRFFFLMFSMVNNKPALLAFDVGSLVNVIGLRWMFFHAFIAGDEQIG